MIRDFFAEKFSGKTIGLLGIGREGIATWSVLSRYLPNEKYVVADLRKEVVQSFKKSYKAGSNISFFSGEGYQEAFAQCDVVFKSPGVSLKNLGNFFTGLEPRLTSQTEVLLELFREQVIGVTGTKGKSTTASLLQHIFEQAGRQSLLAGNIGVPPFELLEKTDPSTVIILEMSSHQLETLTISPATAILLNIFEEHLDHYESYKAYQLAKMNISRWQEPKDVCIYNESNELLRNLLKEYPGKGSTYAVNGLSAIGNGAQCSEDDLVLIRNNEKTIIHGVCKNRLLPGYHNLTNILSAATAALIHGIEPLHIQQSVATFKGLAHRLELVGEFKGVRYYNDSISTVPQSTIEAIKTFPDVYTLILGGYDRGVDYQSLIGYLLEKDIAHLVFIGKAGKRMFEELSFSGYKNMKGCHLLEDFEAAVLKAVEVSTSGHSCLLSPAAASYDMFENFEKRGEKFRQIIKDLSDDAA